MTNKYTEMLEKIVGHMKLAVSENSKDISQNDYSLWLDFLRKVYPESALLQDATNTISLMTAKDGEFGKKVKIVSDIGEIIFLAEEKQYPTWFIQPKFMASPFVLEYEQGQIKQSADNTTIPNIVETFTGKISGQPHDEKFIVNDIDIEMNFLKKMECLESLKLTTQEYVLFPTNRMAKIPINKLESLFHNYVSQAQEQGYKVDGIVIVSDVPLFEVDEQTSNRRIAFTVM